ncbi:hypothetical protein PALA111701_26345 [Paenibacillus lactis]
MFKKTLPRWNTAALRARAARRRCHGRVLPGGPTRSPERLLGQALEALPSGMLREWRAASPSVRRRQPKAKAAEVAWSHSRPGCKAPAAPRPPEATPTGVLTRGGLSHANKQASSASRQAEMEEACLFKKTLPRWNTAALRARAAHRRSHGRVLPGGRTRSPERLPGQALEALPSGCSESGGPPLLASDADSRRLRLRRSLGGAPGRVAKPRQPLGPRGYPDRGADTRGPLARKQASLLRQPIG